MGTHLIPREVDGEGRILIIFTMKGFVGTLIGIGIGTLLYNLLNMIGAPLVGWILLGMFALVGFVLGQVKLPKSNSIDLFRKTGGDFVYEIIIKYLKFRKKRKIYTYDEGGRKK